MNPFTWYHNNCGRVSYNMWQLNNENCKKKSVLTEVNMLHLPSNFETTELHSSFPPFEALIAVILSECIFWMSSPYF